MDPVDALTRLGGSSTHDTLMGLTTEKRLRKAVDKGLVLRPGRGRYVLPTAREAHHAAAALAGVASHLSAAAIHGWQIAHQPTAPSVIVPRNRKVHAGRRRGVQVRYRTLGLHEHDGIVTSAHRTVMDCARDLPFAEALAVADSALRHRAVDRATLERLAVEQRTVGRRRALRVVEAASPLAANPFESVLRATALDVPDLDVEPQVWVEERGFRGRPDLVDRRRRIVLEADSYGFHSSRSALRRDCERYNGLVVRGWTVLRFSWEHVMFQPDYVRDCLVAVVEGQHRRATLPPTLLYSA